MATLLRVDFWAPGTTARLGDWLIETAEQAYRVITPEAFAKDYQIIKKED